MRKGSSTRATSALVAITVLWAAMLVTPIGLLSSDNDFKVSTLGTYPVTVNVTVRDNLDRALEGAQVSVVGSAAVYPTSDPNGTVLISDLFGSDISPGTAYNITASLDGYTEAIHQVWIMANETYNLTLVLNGAAVYGIVLTSLGQPLVGANVSASATRMFHTTTGSDGGYQISAIPAGFYYMSASMGGYQSVVASDVNLSAGMAVRKDFNLTPLSGSISGYVMNDAGVPVLGANVSVTIGGLTITRLTNESGFYNQTGLPEGTYSVTVSLTGFFPNTLTDVLVNRGMDTKNVNLTLYSKPNRLYGVVKAGTLLLPGVNISLMGTSYYNISNYEGSYQITNITAGKYNISASLSGYATNITEISIPAGSDILVLINLRQLPGAQLMVKVTATDTNTPVVGVLVTISLKGGDPLTQSTNIDGIFAFTGLTPGNYTVQLVKDGYKPIELRGITIAAEENETLNVQMEPLRKGDTGFIFGFDMAHSMMILALFLTIIILAMAVWLRIRTFQAPENAPAVYDEEPEKTEEEHADAMNELTSTPEKESSNDLERMRKE